MAEEKKNETQLSERLSELGGGGRSHEARSNLKSAAAGAALAALVGGGIYLGTMLPGQDSDKTPIRETSRVDGFAQDSAAMAAPERPAAKPPIIQTEFVPDPEQQRALDELHRKMTALTAQLDAQASEKDRAAQQALDELRTSLAANIEGLQKQLEDDRNAATKEQDRLSNALKTAQDKATAERHSWEVERRALENRLAAAQNAFQNAGPSPEELDAQRREAERLRRMQQAEEQYMARVNSGMIAFKGADAANADAATREMSGRESFVASSAKPVAVSVSTKIAQPSITVVQGTIIQAALETAIDSSLPGTLRAIVSEDVHSFDGRNILIPQGSKLFGEYQADLTIADSRILVAWNRVVTPEGRTAVISSYGADDLGRSGTTGHVHRHFMQRFGAAAMISIIGAAPTLAASNVQNSTARDTLENIGNDLSRQTGSVIGDYLSIPPTIRVDQGARIAVILDRDVVLP